jgi:hypothetical protein
MGRRIVVGGTIVIAFLVVYLASFVVLYRWWSGPVEVTGMTFTPDGLPTCRPWRLRIANPCGRWCWRAYRPLILLDEAMSSRCWFAPPDPVEDEL